MPDFSGLRINGVDYNIAGGGGTGSVTGVKGAQESTYRTGNVNLTPANIGALPSTTTLADLQDDATHRTVTDTEKATWNGKADVSDIPDVSTKYDSNDSASTDIADGDYVPFYDTSATARKKTLWSNIKAKLKAYFDTIYSTFSGSYNDLTDKPTIPTKTSELTNDSNFITNAVDNLVNYYKKSETYTQAQIDNLLNNKISFAFVSPLPDTGLANVIYFVRIDDYYDEYIYLFNYEWVKIGSTNIPTVGNGTLTIQKNGTDVATFTANQSGNTTANITLAKSDVGLGNVPNVTTNNQTPTFTQASTRVNIASGETLATIFGKIMKWFADLKTVAFNGNLSDLTQSASYRTVTDDEKTTWNGKVNKSGDTMTGQLDIRGTAGSKPLKTRGVIGSDGAGVDGDLYLQYGNSTSDTVYFGNTAGGNISNNGTQYSGNSATATNASKVNNHTVNKDVPSDAKFTDTTYTSKSAVSGGTDVSLCTTGEKYIWNNKQDTLVSSMNIVTINGHSLLASGNLEISAGGATWGQISGTLSDQLDLRYALEDRVSKSASSTSLIGKLTWTGQTSYVEVANSYVRVSDTSNSVYNGMLLRDDCIRIKTWNGTIGTEIKLGDTVLWTNPSPTASFAGQTVNLSFGNTGANCLEDFDYWSVAGRRRSGNYSGIITTGLIPTITPAPNNVYDIGFLQWPVQYMRYRNCGTGRTVGTPTIQFTFGNCVAYSTYGSSTTSNQNDFLIPYQIIGWKFHN